MNFLGQKFLIEGIFFSSVIYAGIFWGRQNRVGFFGYCYLEQCSA